MESKKQEKAKREISDAGFLLRLPETALLNKLGSWKFQMDTYRVYDPDKILKMDFEKKGLTTYEYFLKQIQEKICTFWNEYGDSEIFADTKDIYFLIIGLLLASNVPYNAAMYIGALLVKRGLNHLCK